MTAVLPARRRTLARAAAVLLAGASLCACAGIKTPSIFHLGQGSKGPKSKLKGERIAVLGLNDKLEPNAALKGIDFAIPAAQAQPDWPQAGGTPSHAVENVVAAPQMKELWRRNVGVPSGITGHITASPVLADGKLFVMDGQATVSALDPATGRELWRSSFQPRRGPDREEYGGGLAYADGALFVSSGYRFVAAMNPADGTVKWRRDTPVPVHGAPTVSDGRVFVVDVEDEMQTYAEADGAPGWTYQGLDENARMLKASSPAVDGQTVVSGFASGELVALSTVNGSQLWSTVLSLTNRNNALSEIRDIAGRPVVYKGDVIAGSHSGIMAAIDLRAGQPRWSLPIATTTTPWPAGDVVYVVSTAGQLVCISRSAGQVYWIQDLNAGVPPKRRAVWTGAVLASDRLILASDKGEVRVIDPHTGKLQRSVNLKVKRGVSLSPVPVDGRLYVMTDAAELIAFG